MPFVDWYMMGEDEGYTSSFKKKDGTKNERKHLAAMGWVFWYGQKCGKGTPCKLVHVPVPPGTLVTTEYYPEAWKRSDWAGGDLIEGEMVTTAKRDGGRVWDGRRNLPGAASNVAGAAASGVGSGWEVFFFFCYFFFKLKE
jgi:hypothetical protein